MALKKLALAGVAVLALWMALPLVGGGNSAEAVVDELVAAYCSGGDVGAIDKNGLLGPPGLLQGPAEAAPVIAGGVLTEASFPNITDVPQSKYPEGTSVFTLDPAQSDHQSAAHCKARNP